MFFIRSIFYCSTGFRQTPSPCPYATALLPGNQIAESVYARPESVCPSRVSYYASSQLTQVCRSFIITYLQQKKPLTNLNTLFNGRWCVDMTYNCRT